MSFKRFNISLPADLVAEVDAAAKADFTTRSSFIREAISLQLRVNDYVEHEITDKNSTFNAIKAVNFSRYINRSVNRDKHLPYME